MSIRISRKERPGAVILTVSREPPTAQTFEVDLMDCDPIEKALNEEMGRGFKNYVIDLKNVSYMHSRAFWAIVRTGEQALLSGGKLIGINLSSYLRRLVDLTSACHSVFPMESLNDALEEFSRLGPQTPDTGTEENEESSSS